MNLAELDRAEMESAFAERGIPRSKVAQEATERGTCFAGFTREA